MLTIAKILIIITFMIPIVIVSLVGTIVSIVAVKINLVAIVGIIWCLMMLASSIFIINAITHL
jgi:hypothetical protein